MYFAPPSSPGLESPLTPLDGGHNRLGLETFAVLRTREMTLRVAHECFKKKTTPDRLDQEQVAVDRSYLWRRDDRFHC